MGKNTDQLKFWEGEQGVAYADRNPQSVEELDALYIKDYGITRQELNRRFLGNLDCSLKILEVGANTGLQLEALRRMGFKNLLGIEINDYAIKQSKKIHPNLNIIKASAFDLPFKDKEFDLVYTAGVLIHIAPEDLKDVLDEIYRVSKRYVWCYEYAADQLTEVTYRGKQRLFWKDNFLKLYTDRFPDLKVIKQERIPVLNSQNFSQMFLLEKK